MEVRLESMLDRGVARKRRESVWREAEEVVKHRVECHFGFLSCEGDISSVGQ